MKGVDGVGEAVVRKREKEGVRFVCVEVELVVDGDVAAHLDVEVMRAQDGGWQGTAIRGLWETIIDRDFHGSSVTRWEYGKVDGLGNRR